MGLTRFGFWLVGGWGWICSLKLVNSLYPQKEVSFEERKREREREAEGEGEGGEGEFDRTPWP